MNAPVNINIYMEVPVLNGQSEDIRIMLASDLHLGLDCTQTGISAEVRMETFQRIAHLAEEYDVLLLAGDLFDSADPAGSLQDEVRAAFGKLAGEGVLVAYCPGKREKGADGRPAPFVYSLNAGCVFANSVCPRPFRFEKQGQILNIYGVPSADEYNPACAPRDNGADGFHLGLFNFDFQRERTRAGFRLSDMEFYALGSNHSFKMFKVFDSIVAVYPGSPEAVKPDERGDRYVVSFCINAERGVTALKRLPVNSVRLREEVFNCSGLFNATEIIESLAASSSEKDLITVILEGVRQFPISEETFKKIGEFCRGFRLEDRTIPMIGALLAETGSRDCIERDLYAAVDRRLAEDVNLEEEVCSALKLIKSDEIYLEDWLCGTADA